MLFKKSKYKCKAAEHSILFQPSGEVFACHYNRGYILGKYPENTIKQIWNSKKRKALIKSINEGNFKFGCHECKKAIDSGLFHSAGINKYEYIKETNKKVPTSMEFQLDNICNLQCIMCSGEYSSQIRKYREKGSAYVSPYNDKFVTQLKDFIPNIQYAAFTGGEPFLFDIYYKIWDEIKLLNPKLQIYISTNGTILNDRVKFYITNLNFNFAISIDSLNKSNYESIRKNANFETTINNINYFIDFCKNHNREISIKCLVTPFNFHDLPELVHYFNNKSINVIPKTVLLPGFASISNLNKYKLQEVISTIKSIKYDCSDPIQEKNKIRFNEIITYVNTLNNLPLNNKLATNIELISLLKERIQNVLLNMHKKNEIDYFINRFEYLINSLKDKDNLNIALNNLMTLNTETIINELNRTDLNKFIARFKQIKPK